MRLSWMVAALAMGASAAASAELKSTPALGTAEGRCRPGEAGPAFLVNLVGLKDRAGMAKVELYPANEADWLADDNKLISAGKPFRRVRENVAASGPVVLCIRAPAPGVWALAVLHDRDRSGNFSASKDGVGFPGNPARLGPRKPALAIGRATVGPRPTPINVRLLYRSGLISFAPLS